MSEERTGKLDLSAKRRALLQALLREQDAADLAAVNGLTLDYLLQPGDVIVIPQ